jgi:G:T/U-mismatch repair DNA glycosylase
MKIHPWLDDHPIKLDAKYLILGTHPPMPYCGNLEFYYGNMNEFWKFMDVVYPGHKLFSNGCPKLEDIVRFLDTSKISVTDLVYRTKTEKFNMDDEMGLLNPEDLNPYLAKWLIKSKVEIIFFTSFGGKNSAKNLFRKWYKSEFNKVCKLSKSHVNYIEMFNRKIKLIDLFSPSPTAKRSSPRIKEYIEWCQEKEENNNYDAFRIYWYKKHLPKL